MKKFFVLAFLMFFVVMGLFSSPTAAADSPNPIAGEWVWKSKEVTNTLLIGSFVDEEGGFSGSFVKSSSANDGKPMLFSIDRGRIVGEGEKISFILYSTYPDRCKVAVASGEVVKQKEMTLLFSLPPHSIACSSEGKSFTAIFRKKAASSSNGPVSDGPMGGPTGGPTGRGGPPVGGGPIN